MTIVYKISFSKRCCQNAAHSRVSTGRICDMVQYTELEFLNAVLGGQEPSRNGIIVPARQATQAGEIHSLESIPGLHKRLKIRALLQLQGGEHTRTADVGRLFVLSRNKFCYNSSDSAEDIRPFANEMKCITERGEAK